MKPSPNLTFSLHNIARTGKLKILASALSQEGVNLLELDQCKRTLLHYAAEYANSRVAAEMVATILLHPDCTEIVPESYGLVTKGNVAFINQPDLHGNTALHLAAFQHNADVVSLLIEKGADLTLKNSKGEKAIRLIYKNVPSVMKRRFDCGIKCKMGQNIDEDLFYEFNFSDIILHPRSEANDNNWLLPETHALFHVLEAEPKKREMILEHPLVQMFLRKKWEKIRVLLWLSILYHAIWLVLYSMLIHNLYVTSCPYNSTCKNWMYSLRLSLVVIILSATTLVKELYKLWKHKWNYLRNLENLFNWVVVISPFVALLPHIENFFLSLMFGLNFIKPIYYQISAVSIVVAWGMMLQQVAKIPQLGAYIEMLKQGSLGFALFLATFLSLFVGFVLALQLLLPKNEEYKYMFWGMARLLVMMSGDSSLDDLFGDTDENPFPQTVKLLYLGFSGLVVVVLFNLLIAMTVSDTQKLQKSAEARHLSNQLTTIHLMETFVSSRIFLCCCSSLVKLCMLVKKPEKVDSYIIKVSQSSISSELQTHIKDIAIQYDDTNPVNIPNPISFESSSSEATANHFGHYGDENQNMKNLENPEVMHNLKCFIAEMFEQYEIRRHNEHVSLIRQLKANGTVEN